MSRIRSRSDLPLATVAVREARRRIRRRPLTITLLAVSSVIVSLQDTLALLGHAIRTVM